MKTRKLIIISLIFTFVFSLFTVQIPEVDPTGDQWLIDWNYRKSHVINSATGAGANYQTRIKVYYGIKTTAVSIKTVDDDKAIEYASNKKIFRMANRFWVFYTDESYVRYQTSTNGITWADPINIRTGLSGSGMRLSLFFDGTYIHYVYSVFNDKIVYRRGTPETDGTIDWSASEQTVVSASDIYYVSIAVNQDGYPFIGYTRTVSPYFSKVVKSSTNDGTWTTDWTETLASASGDHHFRTVVRTLSTNRIYAVHSEPSGGGGLIYGNLWNGSSWGSKQTITWSDMYHNRWDVIAEGDDLHLTFTSGPESDNLDIRYVKGTYSAGSHSWGSEVIIDGTPTSGTHPAITRNASDLYVLWANFPETNHVYYRKYDAGTSMWESRVDWLTEPWTTWAHRSLDAMLEAVDGYIGVFWQSNTPYTLRFACLLPTGWGGEGDDEEENVYLSGKCRTDFGDIRFTDDNGITPLDYWMEEKVDGNYAVFWVEVAEDLSTTDQTIYIYYGKNDATTTSSGDNTFIFFDDFDDNSRDTSKWDTVVNGSDTVNEVNQRLEVTGVSSTTSSSGYVSSSSHAMPQRMASVNVVELDNLRYFNVHVGPTKVTTTNPKHESNWYCLFKHRVTEYWYAEKSKDGAKSYVDNGTWAGATGKIEIGLDQSNVIHFYENGIERASETFDITGGTTLYLYIFQVSHSEYGTDAFDNFYLRKFVSPEPSHGSWGAEEEYSPPPFLFEFHGLFNETTGLMEAIGVNVTAHFTTGVNITQTFEVNGTYNFGASVKPQYFTFDLTNNREYWLSEDETSAIIYIFDDDTTTYTISFLDLAGTLDEYSFVSAKRYINGTSHTVEKRKVDVEKKIIMNLVDGRKYDIVVSNGASYVFGDLLMTSVQNVQLTLKGLEFPERIILGYKYVRVYATRNMTSGTPITIFYEDTLDQTTWVETKVYFQSNNSVAWTNTTTASTFIAYWHGSDNVTDYWCEVTINHAKFGIMTYRQVLPRVFSGNPWGLPFLGILPFNTNLLIPAFILLCVFGVFSALNVVVGLFAGVSMATILAYIGWVPIGPEVLILAWAFVIITALAYGKRRVYAA